MRTLLPTFSLRHFTLRYGSSLAPLSAAAALLLTAGAPAQSPSAKDLVTLAAAADLPSAPLTAALKPASLSTADTAGLPDAPSTVASIASSSLSITPSAEADPIAEDIQARRHDPKAAQPAHIIILPGQTAPRQTARDKLVGSVRDAVSPFSFGGELISAGYSHLTNGSPNYGTNSTAFAQRFGASVARGTSQNLFQKGAMAAILHEDPRFYQMGSGQPFVKRLVYAGTRPLITRTDSGKSTPNLALLSGYFGAAALTKVYYPQPNQGFNQTLITYGGSIGGAALGYITSEFLSDTLEILHLEKSY